MSQEEAQKNKKDAYKSVNLIKEYNDLMEEIPWKSLTSFPDKMAKYAKMLPGLSLKAEDIDMVTPIKKVVTYVGIVVQRLRQSEKELATVQQRLAELEKKVP